MPWFKIQQLAPGDCLPAYHTEEADRMAVDDGRGAEGTRVLLYRNRHLVGVFDHVVSCVASDTRPAL